MKYLVMFVLALTIFAFAGTFSGNLLYPGGSIGLYPVVVLGPDDIAALIAGGEIDFTSLPMDTLFFPGPYEVTGDFNDLLSYTIFGLKINPINMVPVSGDPMGLHPVDVIPFGGDAWDKDVTIAPTGAIGGHITYSGDIAHAKVNVYDMMTGTAVFETVLVAGAFDYSVVMKSGFKTLEFFADVNGNNTWDADYGEGGAEYMMGTWGPVVFAGGGDRFATGVDITIPPSRIAEKNSQLPELSLTCFPNPFNSSCEISVLGSGFSANPAQIEIFDLDGRCVCSPSPSVPLPKGEGSSSFSHWEKVSRPESGRMRAFIWTPDKSISSGAYFIKATASDGQAAMKRIVYLK